MLPFARLSVLSAPRRLSVPRSPTPHLFPPIISTYHPPRRRRLAHRAPLSPSHPASQLPNPHLFPRAPAPTAPLAASAALRRVDAAVAQAAAWAAVPQKPALSAQLADDPPAVAFVMHFVDRVMRPEDPKVAADFLHRLVARPATSDPTSPAAPPPPASGANTAAATAPATPAFLSLFDRALVAIGGIVAPILPRVAIPLARARMQALVAPFVAAVETNQHRAGSGTAQRNVNLLGEAVLGNCEAERRRAEAAALLREPDVAYVSVKVTGVTSQLHRWDFDGSVERVLASLRPLFAAAAARPRPRVLLNLDMEEYHDLELTLEAFMRLLDEPEFRTLDAGIVLQTYLPDALPALQRLVAWAHSERRLQGGEGRGGGEEEVEAAGEIKVRLVKGANLAMEQVDAAVHGWEQAPYTSKSETDANYLRCLDWVLRPEHLHKVRIGVASHNLFLLAYAKLLAAERGVAHRVGFEMLRGMTPAHTDMLAEQGGHGMLLYTPVCRRKDFDSAIAYLFRRFEEASSHGNFLRSLPQIADSDSPAFRMEEQRFRVAAAKRPLVSTGPRRQQLRPAPASHMRLRGGADAGTFINEPDSDPCLPNVRQWGAALLDPSRFHPASEESWVRTPSEMSQVLARARHGAADWSEMVTPAQRRAILTRTADLLASRRGDIINALVFEGSKTIEQADPEVSETIDFANYYGLTAEKLPPNFESFGVVAVLGPWNFPAAIPAGGVFAALAAGNAAVLKPSSVNARCAEIVAECAWEAGVPRNALQLVQCGEDEVGKQLVTSADAVILTGATDTANLFRSWKKDIRLIAETSGKNALVISPAADIDLAVDHLVNSAFSYSGQKCSSSSLAVCIGSVYQSDRFRRQLKDAVESLKIGQAWDIATVMGPIIAAPNGKLLRALTTLDEGEEWLVEPKCLDSDGEGRLWTPGVRLGVKPGSWFHQTEVFGPVLGLMHASSLDEALKLQNATAFGLTAGLHSLDKSEIYEWSERVEAGNLYINRGTTGAIVERQSFGGWKGSCVGPGAKAGGPNYVAQLGTVFDDDVRNEEWLSRALVSDEAAWDSVFSKEVDAAQLYCERNGFRYRPLNSLVVRVGTGANEFEVARVRAAASRSGVRHVVWSRKEDETVPELLEKMKSLGVERVRTVGEVEQRLTDGAADMGLHVACEQVVGNGRVELLHYLREQSISQTTHRFGNVSTA